MQSYRFLRLVIGTHPEHIPAVLTLQPAQALARWCRGNRSLIGTAPFSPRPRRCLMLIRAWSLERSE
jgi:hypothetical protein